MTTATTPSERLDVLYEDTHCIAVHKPAGLLVHKSPIDRHEHRYAMKILRDQLSARVYPVHRLDKPTSGLLLFAKSPESAAILAQQFEQRQVEKQYLALVRGWCAPQGRIDHELRHVADFKHEVDAVSAKPAQAAHTHFARMACFELPWPDGRFATSRYSLVSLTPLTGRKHQLRRHMKHISHPIVGDVKYGKGSHNRRFREQLACHRLLLAATDLHLAASDLHATPLHIHCPLEDEFTALLQRLDAWRVDE